jgi:tetratricopeptide (TPR) repeat protein
MKKLSRPRFAKWGVLSSSRLISVPLCLCGRALFPFQTSLVVLSLLLFLSLAPTARSQANMAGHVMAPATIDEMPPEKYPVPEKLTGIGNVHINITASPEAQMWFDQGLNLYHDFWDYESVRAFEQGVRVDPQCAMCHWGLYLALTFRRSATKQFADQALAKAVSLKGRTSKAERLYIEATKVSQDADENKNAAKAKGKDGESKQLELWRKLVKTAPRDSQAKIFLAEELMEGYEDDGTPKAGTKEALAILQAILKEEPENSAANHYWIHAVEASPKPEQALHSAEILGRLAPASGHMVHMPGHIFYRTGDYVSAEKSFGASTHADESYMAEKHVSVDDDWNYVHNLMYRIANLMEEGRLSEATELSAKLKNARGQLSATLYLGSPRDGISRLNPRLPVALRTADWSQVLDLLKDANPPDAHPNLIFLAHQLKDFAAGMQAIESHDLPAAEEASQRLDAEQWRVSQRIAADEAAKEKDKKKDDDTAPKNVLMPDAMAKPLLENVSIMSLELRAGILVAKNQLDEAKKLYAEASRQDKELGYREPPVYIRPVGETQAAALLSVSAWSDAKAAYQQALIDRPKSGFPLYGIAFASEKSGDLKSAATEYATFVSEWKSADASLPQLAHAQAFLAEHKTASAGN